MKFNELNLKKPILTALEKLKYEEPSPIQEKSIPVILDGRDVLGCAQTGSGKTAAFALPILNRLSEGERTGIRALILTPTRELAIQICENMKRYGQNLSLSTGAVYGGVEYEEQKEMIEEGLDILVATPGRLLDLIKQGCIKLRQVEILVIDEADRMLDMGFIKDIRALNKKLPEGRQTVMFSATMPKPIERLADNLLKNPETIMQDIVTNTVDTVNQYVYQIDEKNKLELLVSLIKSGEVKNAIVFTNTRLMAETVSKHLTKSHIRARAIHSEKNQNSRQDALLQFKNKKVQILVATEVAARGIDIKHLSHVINFEIPENAESYIHRIGRTGRAGAQGTALNFCCINEMEDMKRIEEHIGKKLPLLDSPWAMNVFTKKAKPVKRGKRNKKDEVLDITKVKNLTLDGRPKKKKKSNYQYHMERAMKEKYEEEQSPYARTGNSARGKGAQGYRGAGNKASGYKTSESRTTGSKTYGNKTAGNKTSGYKASGYKSAGKKSSYQKSSVKRTGRFS